METEPPKPPPDRDGGEPGDLRGRAEGHPLLPTDDEEPELSPGNFHGREPGDRGETERFPAFPAPVPVLRPRDTTCAAAGTERPFSEGGTSNGSTNLGFRGNSVYDAHMGQMVSVCDTNILTAVPF